MGRKQRVPSRLVTGLGAIIARLIGVNALVAAMGFGLVAAGRVSPVGLSGVLDSDQLGYAAMIAAVCVVLALLFLVSRFANGFLRRRGVGVSILFAPFQFIAAGWAVTAFAVLTASQLGGAQHVWLAYVLTVLAVFVVLYILPGAAAPRHETPEGAHSAEADWYSQDSAHQPAYRILETVDDTGAADRLEERRRRLVAEADHSVLPGGVRRRVRGPRPGRVRLAVMVVTPLVVVGAFALYARFFATFLPSAEVTDFANAHAVTFAIYGVAAGILCAGYCDLDITRVWVLRNRIVNFLILPLAFGVAAHSAFLGAVAVGLPDIHALRVGGPPATARVVVSARHDGEARFACDYSVLIKVGPDAPPHVLCDVGEDAWRALSPGEPLFLTGIATKYGLRYHDIRR